MIGRTLQHYEVLEKLGSGGMGEVYVARDTKLNRQVALKVLPPELSGHVDRRRRFEREAQAVAALNHPNIVTLHSVEESDGIHFLTMELVEGETLTQAIPHGGMTLERFFDIAVPLADAVSAAHQKGVIHRDLKPANVMVSPDGVPKVLDFGLAKLAEPSDESAEATQLPTTSVTQDGKIVGTFSYMSPEQAEGKPVDARSDVFSLGILLYEMATGERPFQGDTSISVLSAILKDNPKSASDTNPRMPRAVARVIQRCLSKAPEDRFQSAQGLKAELVLLKGESESGDLGEPAPSRQAGEPPSGVFVGGIVIKSSVGLLALAALVVAVWIFSRSGEEAAPVSSGAAVTGEPDPSGFAADGRKRIAVLPLENLGPADEAYFAAGITEEITSRLAAVSGLAVISRASTQSYDRSGKSMQEIGQDLGVDYVLDGTVRWQRSAGGESRVRVTPPLIEAATDTQLWSDRLDRSMEDLFQVQSEIATSVVKQLGVTLMSGERDAVEATPTENLEAYQEYLRGKELVSELVSTVEWGAGIDHLKRAVELDPEFAVGWAELSISHSQMHHYREDLSQERLNLARAAADRSLSLRPDLPEARIALGYYYYWGHKDYEQALEQFALVNRPDEPKVHEAVAYIHRRQGRFEDALNGLQSALKLDPRNANLKLELASTSGLLRRYADAESWLRQALELAPNNAAIYARLIRNHVDRNGDLAAARRALDAMPASDDPQRDLDRIHQARREGSYQEALDVLASTRATVFQAQEYYWPPSLLQGHTFKLMGRSQEAKAACEQAESVLLEKVEEDGREHRYHAALGLVYACLGQGERAIQEATLGSDLYPLSRDRFGGLAFVENLVLVLAQVGEIDRALDRLEPLVTEPGELSWYIVARDPLWKALWDDPRFQAMEERLSYQ
jgi:TolB-like protein/Flp pilus assembly protein TadD